MTRNANLSEQTRRALAILQAAIDADKARKRTRYSHGYDQKPLGHDELNAAFDVAIELLGRAKKESA